jgi:hypothetical protein
VKAVAITGPTEPPADRICPGHRDQAPIAPGDCALEVPEPTDQALEHLAGERRHAPILEIAEHREQLAQALPALRPDQPELGQVAAPGVDRRRALARSADRAPDAASPLPAGPRS